MVLIILCLMFVSLLVISSMTISPQAEGDGVSFLTYFAKSQIKWYVLGWLIFFFFAGYDYQRLRKYTPGLYLIMIALLLGLFFTSSIQSVHRWYRLPFVGFYLQPSEYAKIIVVFTLGLFLEKRQRDVSSLSTAMQTLIIVGIPFLLILKQPDLGTALVLFPITLVMCYVAGVNKFLIKSAVFFGTVGLVFMSLIFTGALSHEKMKPFFTTFMKEYQYNRLDPNTYHQKAAQISIAIGGVSGSGWNKSEFSSKKWLPAAHTDSVFAAYAEEFGLIGVLALLLLFFGLIYISFRVSLVAKDNFGKLLASGIAVYLAMHIIVNIGMMCGFLPISGVPLILITYGGSSIVTTMAALGILQSIYTRRFMF